MGRGDGGQLKLHVWDTGGQDARFGAQLLTTQFQERFRAMTHLYYRDAAGAVRLWLDLSAE